METHKTVKLHKIQVMFKVAGDKYERYIDIEVNEYKDAHSYRVVKLGGGVLLADVRRIP